MCDLDNYITVKAFEEANVMMIASFLMSAKIEVFGEMKKKNFKKSPALHVT